MRNSSLDILRGVAVLLVFSRHAGFPPLPNQSGWIGVDLFFVLSGFLVSGLLFREYQKSGAIKPFRFLIRRGFKIYPQFFLMIAVTAVCAGWLGHTARPPQILAEAAFLQNYFPGIWEHTWSLAVEEHFYILLALAVAFVAARAADPFRALPKWILAICTLVLVLRVITAYRHPEYSGYTHHYPSHLRIDSLLGGVLLSYFHVFHPAEVSRFVARFRSWLNPASVLLIAPVAFLDVSHPFIHTAGFSCLWLGFGLLLMLTLYPQRPHSPGPAGSRLAQLGRMSYAFYLWHMPVIMAFLNVPLFFVGILPANSVSLQAFILAGALAATILVAWATTKCVELPLLQWRDRIVPSVVKAPLIASAREVEPVHSS